MGDDMAWEMGMAFFFLFFFPFFVGVVYGNE